MNGGDDVWSPGLFNGDWKQGQIGVIVGVLDDGISGLLSGVLMGWITSAGAIINVESW